ncbi:MULTISPECIES: DUF1793 domain-containing protein [Amycolatopsis]|uniref:glutaminase domain-containing protein n=1 Tax=Amycolatopsis TaxID=1813 RepID=UPI0007DE6A45|nr:MULTISPECIES: DUF1793 domain-containing protein [Amycolatopsis]OAP20261.1 hypothetical protein A4R44_09015 [Amycolatopsis sp. M39]
MADDRSHLRMVGLDLVPLGAAAREAAWYQSKRGAHAVPLDLRHDDTKADWELWTAAWLTGHTDIRTTLVEGVYSFADTTGSRVPFSGWYFVADARKSGFQARPVAAGCLVLLPRPAASTTSWRRIQNRRSGKLRFS